MNGRWGILTDQTLNSKVYQKQESNKRGAVHPPKLYSKENFKEILFL